MCVLQAAHSDLALDTMEYQICHGSSKFVKPDKVASLKRQEDGDSAPGLATDVRTHWAGVISWLRFAAAWRPCRLLLSNYLPTMALARTGMKVILYFDIDLPIASFKLPFQDLGGLSPSDTATPKARPVQASYSRFHSGHMPEACKNTTPSPSAPLDPKAGSGFLWKASSRFGQGPPPPVKEGVMQEADQKLKRTFSSANLGQDDCNENPQVEVEVELPKATSASVPMTVRGSENKDPQMSAARVAALKSALQDAKVTVKQERKSKASEAKSQAKPKARKGKGKGKGKKRAKEDSKDDFLESEESDSSEAAQFLIQVAHELRVGS